VRYQLLFERFLAPERIDPPDIDIDFPWDERDAVIASAFERYGHEHVAMVSTHQSIRTRGALRDTARALGKSTSETGRAARAMELRDRYRSDQVIDEEWLSIAAGAAALVGMPRHYGLHCGGVVITPEPIRELVPVHPAAKTIAGQHVPAIAWEKDGAEDLGLVKIDLLGNRSLAVVRDATRDLRRDGITISEMLWHPEDDILTQRLVRDGNTIGCFYIESPATRLLNAKAGRIDFDRLVVHSSIIRPAAASWITTYLERLHQVYATGMHDDSWYPHPALRELLSEAYGVLCYQEDVMLVAQRLAGFGSREQNTLRKALGRSDTPQRLAALEHAFAAGCAANAVTPAVRDHVWSMITSFAGYSFCKAHSASYVMVSFQCAYLKAHHPAHFFAAVIDNDGGFYSHSAYVEEARRCGVSIHPPCVLTGDWHTRAEGPAALRLGLGMIHGLSRACGERILGERDLFRFIGVADLAQRCGPSRRELRMLLWSNALSALMPDRSPVQQRWITALAAQLPRHHHDEPGQRSLDFAPDHAPDPEPPSDLTPLAQRDCDRRCYAALGRSTNRSAARCLS
jgi:error-prone DNA polymerase